MPKTFELQVFRRAEWRLNSLFECRDWALAKAHDMEQCRPDLPLRVIEESFDAEGRQVATTIVYESPSPQAEHRQLEEQYRETLSSTNRDRLAKVATIPAMPRAARHLTLSGSRVAVMLAVGGVGLTAIFGVLWFGNLVH